MEELWLKRTKYGITIAKADKYRITIAYVDTVWYNYFLSG